MIVKNLSSDCQSVVKYAEARISDRYENPKHPAKGARSEWVLRSGNEIYPLKSQIGIEEFAGQNVKVIGTLDAKTNTIDNASTEPEPHRWSRVPSCWCVNERSSRHSSLSGGEDPTACRARR